MVNTNHIHTSLIFLHHHANWFNYLRFVKRIDKIVWVLEPIVVMTTMMMMMMIEKVSSYKNLYGVHQLHFTLFNSFILIVNTLLTPKGQCTCMNDLQGLCLCLSFVSISSRQVGVRTSIRWSNYLRIRTIKRRWLIQNEREKRERITICYKWSWKLNNQLDPWTKNS